MAPGNAYRDVEFRRHDLAGLADLPVVRNEAGVDGGARGADGRAQSVGNALDQREIVLGLQTAPAGNHDFRSRQLGPLGTRQILADKAREPGIVRRRNRFDHGVAAPVASRQRRRRGR